MGVDNFSLLVPSLKILDPILQFLTKATGNPLISLQQLQGTVAGGSQTNTPTVLEQIPELARRGILQLVVVKEDDNEKDIFSLDPALVKIGFPLASSSKGSLSGSTKAAAKKRMTALVRILHQQKKGNEEETCRESKPVTLFELSHSSSNNDTQPNEAADPDEDENQQALHRLSCLLNVSNQQPPTIEKHTDSSSSSFILPGQAKLAGFQQGRKLRTLPFQTYKIPLALTEALSICVEDTTNKIIPDNTVPTHKQKMLYSHQVEAIESILSGIHTIISTSTGSGKSLCYLLPVLYAAMADISKTATITRSLLIFPTKALAQDQLNKIHSILKNSPELEQNVKVAIIDGDNTNWSHRAAAAEHCHILITNPDTIHASILPNWKNCYRKLLSNIQYIAFDEAHVYQGCFGAHVSYIVSRLLRLCSVASCMTMTSDTSIATTNTPIFIASSATIDNPEGRFRLLCRIPNNAKVKVLLPSDDGSPCSSKYFFIWNPPLLDIYGNSTGEIISSKKGSAEKKNYKDGENAIVYTKHDQIEKLSISSDLDDTEVTTTNSPFFQRRRHAADETARLLALAVASGVRCIAFAKTRCLVELIYEKCISKLKQQDATSHLVEKVEIYRGGYTAEVRRHVENQLFQNKLIGVVGTSALELGVDIGGIDLTLHCGYPGSHTSLMQQAGRAGRGGQTDRPSFSVCICFNSPSEQYLWRNPKALLGDGVKGVNTSCIPTEALSLAQDHILCAAAEFPLFGSKSVTSCFFLFQNNSPEAAAAVVSDCNLFGGPNIYERAIAILCEKGSLCKNQTVLPVNNALADGFCSYSSHPSIKKPWAQVSIRSIEPLQYKIVDTSHPMQGGRLDGIHSDKAVLDVVPYSRIFYHCFPGSIIMHRGRKYKVISLTKPPAVNGAFWYAGDLVVYATKTKSAYFTRALQTTVIEIVKRFESVERSCTKHSDEATNRTTNAPEETSHEVPNGPIAGNGIITVKRTVWGYSKLSNVNGSEISKTELSLPSIEYDTNAFWIDTEASALKGSCLNYDAGVHALSHAVLAVAPMFVSCSAADIDCDHSFKDCTRMLIFDAKAGGGTHASEHVWKNLFVILPAAISVLECCATCCPNAADHDECYDSGCPACLQGIPCVNFHDGLSRKAGLVIAKRILKNLQQSSLFESYKKDTKTAEQLEIQPSVESSACASCSSTSPEVKNDTTPRKKKRATAMENAKHLDNARKRQIVVGRPSWPMTSNNTD